MSIHDTAIISDKAVLGDNVRIGPNTVIHEDVEIGGGTVVQNNVVIYPYTKIGCNCEFFPMSSIGSVPQDLKFGGEKSLLEIGDGNMFREFVTVNRGTENGGGITRIGNNNFFMAYTHIAHDCLVGNRTVFANAATLAGHVEVQDEATVGAFSGVHQFCRIGTHAFIGGYSVITQDALPFVKSVGNRANAFGVNTIGLKRKGFPESEIADLKKAYRLLVKSGKNTSQALEAIESELGGSEKVKILVEFIRTSERGIIK